MPQVRLSKNWPAGKVIRLQHQSIILRDNPWNDPVDRSVHIYLPPNYSTEDEPYVSLWCLAAFTNSGQGQINWRNHGENLPERMDRLIGKNKMPAAVVVLPDCYTSLGGNQYVNSTAVGRYADYLVTELVPFVTQHVNIADTRDGRGVFGKSSGGFGAIYHAAHFTDSWGAAASHAGDAGFDLVYRPAFAEVCTVLAEYDADLLKFIRAFWNKNKPSAGDFAALMTLAMAASYDPDPDFPQNIQLPFDLRTCVLNPDRWKHWLAFDPINMDTIRLRELKKLHGLYFDVGSHDQYHIQYGSRSLADKLRQQKIDFQYHEFEGNHSAIDWRLDYSIPFLVEVLKKALSTAKYE